MLQQPGKRPRRFQSMTTIWCSVQTIALGIFVLSTRDTVFFSGCQGFSVSQNKLVGKSFPHSLHPQQFSDRDNKHTVTTTALSLYKNSNDDDNDDDNEGNDSTPRLPALGPAGTSSHHGDDNGTTAAWNDLPESSAAATATIRESETTTANHSVATFVNPKFALQYTCNICETKNRVVVSRQAYTEGMVIAVCKGCGNKHWIADNLDPTLSHSNIEEYFESRGLGDTVNRVTEEVYEIERVWGLKEGEITDESGDAVLE